VIYNITPEQQVFENLDQQASMWANKIMTRKMTNAQCKFEIAQQVEDIEDMQTRVRKYLKAGLVTKETYAKKLDSQLYRLKQRAKAAPEAAQSLTGSKDGLWSKSLAVK